MMNKRVLLVNPSWSGFVSKKDRRYNRRWPPLSLLICAAELRKNGFKPQLVDGRVHSNWLREFEQAADTAQWVVLTSSPLDRWQCPNLEFNLFVDICDRLPKNKLIITGAHGTAFPKAVLAAIGARCLIIGEPEKALCRLLDASDWSKVPGVVYGSGDEIIHTGNPEPVDLSDLAPPAYDLIDMKDYHYELLGRRFALFESARGCPYQCHFCMKAMYGKRVRYKPVGQFIAEIDQGIRKYGVKSCYFIDLEFTVNRDRALNICQQLIGKNQPLTWCCQTRADAVDEELLSQMKKSGCRLIHFGVESGAGHILKATNKKITRDSILRGIRLTQMAGIDTACFFMFGFPNETEADMVDTMRFAEELNPTFASFHTLTPYPGTLFFEHAFQKGGAKDENLDFPYHLAEHDPKFLDSMVKLAFKRFYLRPAYIASRIKNGNLRSWLAQLRLFGGFIA